MPFALLGLHRYLRDPRPRWLALFAGGWFLQGICNGYYLLFFSVFVGMWILWFASPWTRWREFAAASAAWAAAVALMLPLLLRYRAIHESFGFSRDLETIRGFGADVAALLHAADHLAFWGSLHVYRRAEGELFPGLTIVLLVVAGAIFVRDRERPEVRSWAVARRILSGLAVGTALVSLSAVVMGSWRLEPFGVRLVSVSNPIKPLTFSLLLSAGLALTSPGLRRAYAARSALASRTVAGRCSR